MRKVTGTTLGEALRRKRSELDQSQEEASALLGVSQSRFERWENDKSSPEPDAWPALIKYLGIDRTAFGVLYLNAKERKAGLL